MQQMPENMSGLGAPKPGPETALPAQAVASPDEMGGMGGEMASPEEQAMYERVVGLGLKALYDKKGLPAIVGALDTKDPRAGVATVTAVVMQRVVQAAQKGGQKIPSEILMHAATEILENVIELAENSGVHEFSKDTKMVEGATIRAFDEMRVALQEAGMIDQEEAKADLQELQQADASGALAGAMGAGSPPEAGAGGGLMPKRRA